MATYIILSSWTQKGIESIKDGPDRLDAAKKIFQSMGGELKEFYLVTGQYDIGGGIERVLLGDRPV